MSTDDVLLGLGLVIEALLLTGNDDFDTVAGVR
jgi:hypothetical protein